ncbi:MAG: sulfite exporter TauE/SafE family protein [Syntrophomonadaceae bacterium]|nr:sulfite exporter TauE/SafE family protein [Syntrophomonadaceae bacterium]
MTELNFFFIIMIGFLAQMIDGALGMAYGVSSTTFLTSAGVPAKIASASVHTAEVFTTLCSGFSHWKMKNVDWSVFKRLVFPGVIGGAAGAYVLVKFPGDLIEPLVSVYLLVMGLIVLARGIHGAAQKMIKGNKLIPVGLIGGFFDAVGGGGWGPIVTSTMVAAGHPPRYTIGSVNTAEFFVTIVQTLTFTLFLGIGQYWQYIAGLAIGGVLAAPLAAYVCARVSDQKMLILVGILIIALNVRSILLIFS